MCALRRNVASYSAPIHTAGTKAVNRAPQTWAWIALAAILLLALAVLLRPNPARPQDFYQDWASARNLAAGRAPYAKLDGWLFDYNAHPPTSILLAVPFAGLDYITASVAWNLFCLALLAASVALLLAELRPGAGPASFATAMLLLCLWPPLWEHLTQGQLSLAMLFLLTLAWREARHGRDRSAGALLGLAAALKLFPALLILYLAVHRRWRLASLACASLLALTALTLCITGPAAFREYAATVLPALARWDTHSGNASLNGFFSRLLAPALGHTVTLAVTWAACASVAIAVGLRSARANFDEGFALAVTGLLLVTPLTWQHSLTMLLLPLGIYLAGIANRGPLSRCCAVAGCLLLSLPSAILPGFPPAAHPGIAANLTVLSLNFYGLACFWLAQLPPTRD